MLQTMQVKGTIKYFRPAFMSNLSLYLSSTSRTMYWMSIIQLYLFLYPLSNSAALITLWQLLNGAWRYAFTCSWKSDVYWFSQILWHILLCNFNIKSHSFFVFELCNSTAYNQLLEILVQAQKYVSSYRLATWTVRQPATQQQLILFMDQDKVKTTSWI